MVAIWFGGTLVHLSEHFAIESQPLPIVTHDGREYQFYRVTRRIR